LKQSPSQLKYKKNHKISSSIFFLKEHKNFFPVFGNFGIKCLKAGILAGPELEACRKSIRRSLRGIKCVIHLKAFKGFSITKKGIGLRMGSGKGSHDK
jgi:ribosomal protein L16/L10AE